MPFIPSGVTLFVTNRKGSMMRRIWIAGLVVAALAATASVAYAALSSAVVSGTVITSVKTVGQGEAGVDGWGPMTSAWTQMKGVDDTTTPIAVTMTIPKGHTALFRATLSGDARCRLGDAENNQTCEVRVVVNGAPMSPMIMEFGSDETIDSSGVEHGGPSASTAQFFTTSPLPAGTYKVSAQWRNFGPTEGFWWESNMLSVEEIQAS